MNTQSNLECQRCKGTGWIIVSKRVDLFDTGKLTDYEYDFAYPCPVCNGGHEEKVQQAKKRSNTPAGYTDKDFTAFNWHIYRDSNNEEIDTSTAQKLTLSFIRQYDKWKETGQGLYIYSKVKGSGKTFLASCLMNEIMKKYATRTRFVPSIDLITMDEQKNRKGTTVEEVDPIGYISKIPLIVIDDIGVKNANNWIDEILFKIVDTRLQAKLPTIFTSNIPIDELPYDERVTDRIYKMCQSVMLPEIKVRRMISGDTSKDFLKGLGI